MSSSLKEYLFTTDDKYQPKVLEGKNAKYILIVRLILLEPGTLQTHPDMGVGLISKYRYSDTDDLYDLKTDIENQMKKYLPELLLDCDVSISYQGQQLIINITTEGETQQLTLDTTTGNYKLSDL